MLILEEETAPAATLATDPIYISEKKTDQAVYSTSDPIQISGDETNLSINCQSDPILHLGKESKIAKIANLKLLNSTGIFKNQSCNEAPIIKTYISVGKFGSKLPNISASSNRDSIGEDSEQISFYSVNKYLEYHNTLDSISRISTRRVSYDERILKTNVEINFTKPLIPSPIIPSNSLHYYLIGRPLKRKFDCLKLDKSIQTPLSLLLVQNANQKKNINAVTQVNFFKRSRKNSETSNIANKITFKYSNAQIISALQLRTICKKCL